MKVGRFLGIENFVWSSSFDWLLCPLTFVKSKFLNQNQSIIKMNLLLVYFEVFGVLLLPGQFKRIDLTFVTWTDFDLELTPVRASSLAIALHFQSYWLLEPSYYFKKAKLLYVTNRWFFWVPLIWLGRSTFLLSSSNE